MKEARAGGSDTGRSTRCLSSCVPVCHHRESVGVSAVHLLGEQKEKRRECEDGQDGQHRPAGTFL